MCESRHFEFVKISLFERKVIYTRLLNRHFCSHDWQPEGTFLTVGNDVVANLFCNMPALILELIGLALVLQNLDVCNWTGKVF
jgi:hypothetical protein